MDSSVYDPSEFSDIKYPHIGRYVLLKVIVLNTSISVVYKSIGTMKEKVIFLVLLLLTLIYLLFNPLYKTTLEY